MYNTVNIWTGIIRYIFKNYVLKIRPKNTQKKKKKKQYVYSTSMLRLSLKKS